jgi:hypothetical protein
MKPHGSIQVVRMWLGICSDPVLGCFDDLEGLSYEDLLVGMVIELANGLKLGTAVLSLYISGTWVTIHR